MALMAGANQDPWPVQRWCYPLLLLAEMCPFYFFLRLGTRPLFQIVHNTGSSSSTPSTSPAFVAPTPIQSSTFFEVLCELLLHTLREF